MDQKEFNDFLHTLPTPKQRQDSVLEQLADLTAIANRLGMYDAADAVTQIYPKVGKLKYGCHCDLDDGVEPDSCVIDLGSRFDCIHAKPGIRKEQCEYWRIIA